MSTYFSLGEATDNISSTVGCRLAPWQISRVFELRLLPEPPRICGKRAIPAEMIPQIIELLRARGTIPPAAETPPRKQASREVPAHA
jgi:hypothetical protein